MFQTDFCLLLARTQGAAQIQSPPVFADALSLCDCSILYNTIYPTDLGYPEAGGVGREEKCLSP